MIDYTYLFLWRRGRAGGEGTGLRRWLCGLESGREKGVQVVAWRNAHNVHSSKPDLSPPHTFTCTHTTGIPVER